MKTIGIIGPGAIGCLLAASMKKAGYDVTLIDKNPDRSNWMNKQGIWLQGVSGEFHALVPMLCPKIQPDKFFDLVLVCVKAYATEDAIRMHRSRIGTNTAVLTMQNGYGNVDAIAAHVPRTQILGGITSHGANVLEPGKINHAGFGDTFIGEISGEKTERIRQVKSILDTSGFQAEISENVEQLIFTKLLINVGINALTGILRVKNGKLMDIEDARELMRLAVLEGLRVAEAKKILFDADKIIATVEQVATRTAQNRSSMLMDILNKRRTEIDFINGAVVKMGRDLRIETPVNNVIHHLVRSMEQTFDLRESL